MDIGKWDGLLNAELFLPIFVAVFTVSLLLQVLVLAYIRPAFIFEGVSQAEALGAVILAATVVLLVGGYFMYRVISWPES